MNNATFIVRLGMRWDPSDFGLAEQEKAWADVLEMVARLSKGDVDAAMAMLAGARDLRLARLETERQDLTLTRRPISPLPPVPSFRPPGGRPYRADAAIK